ncbi:MAG: hypothetical protein ABI039_00200 [Vicinamibacterales bacterium]
MILVLFSFALPARGEEEVRDAQVAAATANATEALRADVTDEPLGSQVTVQDLLKKTDASAELMKALHRARRVGGARWIDDQTCQVRLEMPGDRVADALVQIAQSHADTSPIPADAIRQKLKLWSERTFVATGTSAASELLGGLRPMAGSEAWSSVSNEDRKAAILGAKRNVAQRALDGIKPIKLTPTKTVADALADPQVNDAMMAWVQSRPATGLIFRDDLTVEVTLVVPPGEMFDVFRTTLHDRKEVAQPPNDEAWSSVRKVFVDRANNVTGRSKAISQSASQPQGLPLLPARAPGWASQPQTAEATADAQAGGKLRTARAAEAKAVAKLRKAIEELRLSSSQTISQAEKQSKALQAAVDQALQQAKPYKVDYRGDGSVNVRVMLEGRDLWDSLQQAE